MTHFCTFGSVTPVLIIAFGWFFLIDRSRSQTALMQVTGQAHYLTLTLERDWNVKNFLGVIVTNHEPQWHTFKKHWKQ